MSLWQDESGVWRCRYYAGGTARSDRVRKTLGAISAKDAKRKYADLVAKAHARAGRFYLRATLADCAESWEELAAPRLSKGWRATATMILRERLVPHFDNRPADELSVPDVERYRNARLRDEAAPATVNREIAVLMRALSFALASGLIERHPFPKGAIDSLKESKGRLIYFEREEWQRFRAAFDDPAAWEEARGELREIARAKRKTPGPGGAPLPSSEVSHEYRARLQQAMPIFETLLLTGSRLSEILELTWSDVDMGVGTVRIFQGKTARPKIIPIVPELKAVLETQPRGLPGAFVFQRPEGGGRWERDKVYDAFLMARRIAKLRSELVIHSLRHTAGSWMAIAGVPLKTIQEMLGHADARTTQKYLHLQPSHLEGAAGVLGKLFSSSPAVTVPKERGPRMAQQEKRRRGSGASNP